MKQKYAIWLAIAAIVIVAATGVVAVMRMEHKTAPVKTAQASDQRPGATQIAASVSIGGPFTMVDQNGESVTADTYDGRYRIMFFGYTHCPDFCPTKLFHIHQMLDQLPSEMTARIAPIFVSVDPERDTAPILKEYLEALDPRLIGLTGTLEQVDAIAKAYRVYYRKAESEDPEYYSMDHSTFTYVMGPDNDFIDVISYDTPVEAMVEKVSGIIGK
jgi:cytochrome oxidase Cu insertion factor (SCO1/SenC/PrrC family)